MYVSIKTDMNGDISKRDKELEKNNEKLSFSFQNSAWVCYVKPKRLYQKVTIDT